MYNTVNMIKRFLLVDDHSVVRLAVKLIIKEHYFNAQIDEASTGAQTLAFLAANNYDLVIIDLMMPQTDTTDLLEKMLENYPETKILIFTMMSESIFATRYFQLGVKGFLTKDCDEKEISVAIELIMNNKKYISVELSHKLIEDSLADRSENPFEDLSMKEKEIVRLLINGKSVKEIKYILNIQNSTVGTYKFRIFEKMMLSNIVDLQEIARLYHFS